MKESKPKGKRKPYSPPLLEQVDLEPEETLSAGCKSFASGPSGSDCILDNCVSDYGS